MIDKKDNPKLGDIKNVYGGKGSFDSNDQMTSPEIKVSKKT